MKKHPALPPNFNISDKTIHQIREWINNLSEEHAKTFLPAVFMGQVNNAGIMIMDAPMVGAYPIEEVSEEDIFEIRGLRLLFPVLA